MGISCNLEPEPEKPDSIILAVAHAFNADSYSEAMHKAADWLNQLAVDTDQTEPIIRLSHYSSYEKPFTCTIVVPETEEEEIIEENQEQ